MLLINLLKELLKALDSTVDTQSNAMTVGVLSLGTRHDAKTWLTGCEKLGFGKDVIIRKPTPTFDEIEEFFKSSPDWIYLGGHSNSGSSSNALDLFNQNAYEDRPSGKISLLFEDDYISLTGDGNQDGKYFSKSDNNLKSHINCKVILFGGCAMLNSSKNIKILRNMFNNPLMLGFDKTTDYKMVDMALGCKKTGSNGKSHCLLENRGFFELLKGEVNNPEKVRRAWLKAAKKGWWSRGNTNSFVRRFVAIDSDGQEWTVNEKGKFIKGRKY